MTEEATMNVTAGNYKGRRILRGSEPEMTLLALAERAELLRYDLAAMLDGLGFLCRVLREQRETDRNQEEH